MLSLHVFLFGDQIDVLSHGGCKMKPLLYSKLMEMLWIRVQERSSNVFSLFKKAYKKRAGEPTVLYSTI